MVISSQPRLHCQLEVITSSTSSSNLDNNTTGGGIKIDQMNLLISHEPIPTNSNPNASSTQSAPNYLSSSSNISSSYTLESLSLTSFNSPQILSCTPQDQLPLKAVYKSSVVGLRYISINQEDLIAGRGRRSRIDFFRFQVKFKNSIEGGKFVEILSRVCPVKVAEVKSSSGVGGGGGSSEVGSTSTSIKSGRNHLNDRTNQQPQQFIPPALSTPAIQYQPSSHLNQQPIRIPSPQSLPPPVQIARSSTKLPSHLSTFLPNLTASLRPPPPPPAPSAPVAYIPTIEDLQLQIYLLQQQQREEEKVKIHNCTELSRLDPKEFEEVLENVLMDEGFGELVERIKKSLTSGAAV